MCNVRSFRNYVRKLGILLYYLISLLYGNVTVRLLLKIRLITTVPNVNYKMFWGIFSVDSRCTTVLSRGKAASAGISRDSCRARDSDKRNALSVKCSRLCISNRLQRYNPLTWTARLSERQHIFRSAH